MAKNFNKAGQTASFSTVGKESSKFSQVPPIMMLHNEDIIDYPHNDEDISNIEDIVTSIKTFGFTDPIEVTDFGMNDGKYMIVSGHRRRAAGVACGVTEFPCILITLPVSDSPNYDPIADYVLMANSQRDSGKDPLLLVRRYKRHKALLVAQGIHDFRKQLAERMGISVASASRYEAISQLIPTAWKFIEDDVVGMSAICGLNQFSETEQEEICKIISECSAVNDGHVSRDTMKDIINGYKNGCRSWREIPKPLRDSGLPLDTDLDNVSVPTSSFNGGYENSENTEYSDDTDNTSSDNDTFDSVTEDDEDDGVIKFDNVEEIAEDKEEKEQMDFAENLFKHLKTVANDLNDDRFCFEMVNIEQAEEIIRFMKSLSIALINNLWARGNEANVNYNIMESILEDIRKCLDEY